MEVFLLNQWEIRPKMFNLASDNKQYVNDVDIIDEFRYPKWIL